MAERRGARRDWTAWGFLLVGLVLTGCVLGQELPAGPTSENLLGPPGAWLAGELFDALGIAVYVLLAGWLILVLMRLASQRCRLWLVRLSGWLILLPCAALAAALLRPGVPPGPLTGSGGALGAFLSAWLDDNFEHYVLILLYSGCVLLGVTLAADVIPRTASRLLLRTLAIFWAGCRGFGRLLAGSDAESKPSPRPPLRLYKQPDHGTYELNGNGSDPNIIP